MLNDRRINKLIDLKNLEIERRNFIKYNHLITIAIDVLKIHKNSVIAYGGFAINEILPSELKFYTEEKLIDIDLICIKDAFDNIISELKTAYTKNGNKYITVSEALHANTYTLIVDGVKIIDLSITEKEYFYAIQWGGVKTDIGIYTAGIDFLKYSIHLMLSKPEDSFRWTNVYPRMIKLYSVYPPVSNIKYNFENFAIDKVSPTIIKTIRKYIMTKNIVSFGWDIIEIYLNEAKVTPKEFKDKSPVIYLSSKKNPNIVANGLIKELNDPDFVISDRIEENIFTPEHVVISYKGVKWIYIFFANSCYSYITYKSINIFTIHSMIASLYGLYLSNRNIELYNVINILTKLLLNNMSSKKKLLKQLTADCNGISKGKNTLRRERFSRAIKK